MQKSSSLRICAGKRLVYAVLALCLWTVCVLSPAFAGTASEDTLPTAAPEAGVAEKLPSATDQPLPDAAGSDSDAVSVAGCEVSPVEALPDDTPVKSRLLKLPGRYVVDVRTDGTFAITGTVEKGDTSGAILQDLIGASASYSLINAAEPVWSLRRIRAGQPFIMVQNREGDCLSFTYEATKDEQLEITRQEDGSYKAELNKIAYDVQLTHVEGIINNSLFGTMLAQGETEQLAGRLANVFECEINFITEIRSGDSFEVLVEKRYRDGEFKGYGHILAAAFTNAGRRYNAYIFQDSNGSLHHYNEKGEALQMALLKAPLAFTRISSCYTMHRRHPITGVVKPHQGIDYAAPMGTPVKSVGDGVVTRAGWGSGYGNMIVVRHGNGLETQYAHLSRFAKNLRKGTRVSKGQVIGYVGSTGMSTGPHLDFRMRKNGQFVNPDKVVVKRDAAVAKARLEEFKLHAAGLDALMKGEASLSDYTVAPWIQ